MVDEYLFVPERNREEPLRTSRHELYVNALTNSQQQRLRELSFGE
jgi:hypothetical protein